MRYRDLICPAILAEAPISDWLVDDAFSDNEAAARRSSPETPHWTPADRRTLFEPARIARVTHAFSRSPYPINVLFFHLPGGDGTQLQGVGRVPLRDLSLRFGDHAATRIRPWMDRNAINFILTNNVSDPNNHVGLTSGWMLAHRLGHAIGTVAASPLTAAFSEASEALFGCYAQVDPADPEALDAFWDEAMIFALGTMRSARQRKVEMAEFPIELLAQTLIQGRIRLHPPPPSLRILHGGFALRDATTAQRIVDDLAARFNAICTDALQAAIGGIWVD